MTQIKTEQAPASLVKNESNLLLVNGCNNCIQQCVQILEILSQENYVDNSKGSASIGAHIRHIIDRFQCFFAGLPEASIDYDARKRDKEIESNLEAAQFALATVSRRITQLGSTSDRQALIAVRETVLPSSPAVTISSTCERELMGLITHSIHHLAIIVLMAKAFDYEVDEDFGKAPSTIAFERS